MSTRALRTALAFLLVAAASTVPRHALAQGDVFASMNAARVMPPTPAPNVTFRTVEGYSVRLQALRGRPVVLTFFTTW